MTTLSSARGWNSLWGQLRKAGSASLLHPRDREIPLGCFIILEWSSRFNLPFALKERNTPCSLTFVPFWGSLAFRRAVVAAGGIG